MEEKELIALLKAQAPSAPAAPADEWAAIARRVQPWWSGLLPALPWALGGGLAVAGLALVLIQPSAKDDEALEPYLSELAQSLETPATEASYGQEYIALADASR